MGPCLILHTMNIKKISRGLLNFKFRYTMLYQLDFITTPLYLPYIRASSYIYEQFLHQNT